MPDISRRYGNASGGPRIHTVPMSACREHLGSLQAGESPYWDEETGRLWLVDMYAPALISVGLRRGDIRTWPMPQTIGSFALCDDGSAIVALRDGVYRLDLDNGGLSLFARPEHSWFGNRLNDGKVSPDGRFWVGSMNESSPRQPAAALYRIDPDGHVRRMLSGLYTSNGLAWSPDGRHMYHSDSRGEMLWVFEYEVATGTISGGKVIAKLTDSDGRPDGGAVDAEGCYWSAGPSAGVINRFSAEGLLLERYVTPIAAPSMICFGGDDLRTIFVTSLSVERGGRREAGRLISFEAPVSGLPGNRFRLRATASA